MPKDKQPPSDIIWDGSPEDLDEWIERVLDSKHQTITDINLSEVEE